MCRHDHGCRRVVSCERVGPLPAGKQVSQVRDCLLAGPVLSAAEARVEEQIKRLYKL